MYSLSQFEGLEGWTLERAVAHCIISCISAIFGKEDRGFAVIFGILVESCVDGVFLNVLVSFVM